jgi:nucleoside-diphosphate-sugar epimerase
MSAAFDTHGNQKTGRIALTGASGFAGRHILAEAQRRRLPMRVCLRLARPMPDGADTELAAELSLENPDGWDNALAGCETIIHCAGLAHQPAGVDEAMMQAINGEAVGMLAKVARKHGIKRFIQLSSIRAVCGSASETPIEEDTPPAPIDAYGRSKLLGEKLLMDAGIDGAILRMPLLMGHDAKANFGKLMRLAQMPLPLPFAGLAAQRSMLGVATLADAVLALATMPAKPMQTMLIAETQSPDVAALITLMRQSLGRRPNLFWLPEPLFKAAVRVALSSQAWDSLARPLVLKPTRLAAQGWQPPQSLADVIRAIMQGKA